MTPELSQNLEILAQRFAPVLEDLRSSALQSEQQLPLEAIASASYGPKAEGRTKLIQRWVSQADAASCRLLLTSGMGTGEHIEALLNSIHPSSRVIVLEADTQRLLSLLSQRDFTPLLNHPRFVLLTPFSFKEVIQRLNLELVGIESCSRFIFAPVYNSARELYDNLLSAAMSWLTTRWNQIRTDVEHAEKVFANSIQNFSVLGWSYEINLLRNLFEDRPFILVAAGPSLDQSFDFLRQAQGHAVIAVVNSAYRAVVHQGIRPDLTVAVDPNPGTFRGYAGVDTSHSILCCSWLVYPEVAAAFRGRAIPIAEHNFFMNIIRRVLQLPEQNGLIGDGTVSSTVVNLASFFGCRELYLVGQDLAVADDGQSHASDTFYTDDGLNKVDLEQCVKARGNDGSTVFVERKLHAYLKIFENLLGRHIGMSCFNLSPRGAFIHGATPLSTHQALEQLSRFPIADSHALLLEKLEEARTPPVFEEQAKLLLERYAGFVSQLLSKLLAFTVPVECQLVNQRQPGAFSSAADNIAESRQQIGDLIERNPLFFSMLMEGRTKKEFHDFLSAGEVWKPVTDRNAKVEDHLPYAWALVEGAIFQLSKMQEHGLAPHFDR